MTAVETINLCLSKCISERKLSYSNRTVSYLIVVFELLIVLLEYVDSFSKEGHRNQNEKTSYKITQD